MLLEPLLSKTFSFCCLLIIYRYVFVCLVCGIDFQIYGFQMRWCVYRCVGVNMCMCTRDGEEMQKMRGRGWCQAVRGAWELSARSQIDLFCFYFCQTRALCILRFRNMFRVSTVCLIIFSSNCVCVFECLPLCK